MKYIHNDRKRKNLEHLLTLPEQKIKVRTKSIPYEIYFFSSNLDHFINNDANVETGKKYLADQFMRLVEQSDGRLRRVDELASQLNITPKYLSTILKETMNRRPSAIIQLFTMKAIERRLRFTDMTMQAIAIDLNFPNASFFGKYFKQRAGMTPLEYRLKYHKGR